MTVKAMLRQDVMSWLEKLAKKDKSTTINFMTGDPEEESNYTLPDMVREIRKGTSLGKQQYRAAVKFYQDHH